MASNRIVPPSVEEALALLNGIARSAGGAPEPEPVPAAPAVPVAPVASAVAVAPAAAPAVPIAPLPVAPPLPALPAVPAAPVAAAPVAAPAEPPSVEAVLAHLSGQEPEYDDAPSPHDNFVATPGGETVDLPVTPVTEVYAPPVLEALAAAGLGSAQVEIDEQMRVDAETEAELHAQAVAQAQAAAEDAERRAAAERELAASREASYRPVPAPPSLQLASEQPAAGHPWAETDPSTDATSALSQLRASTQSALRRLTEVRRPEPAAPAAGVSIQALSQHVERAIVGSAAAQSYQLEVEQKAAEMASEVVAKAASDAQRTIAGAFQEREALLTNAKAEAGVLVSDAETERDAIIARAEAQAQAILTRAEVELGRRIRRIAECTDLIANIAETTTGRLAAGTLTGGQLANFVSALTDATETAVNRAADALDESDNF